jgi:hypothetical protein
MQRETRKIGGDKKPPLMEVSLYMAAEQLHCVSFITKGVFLGDEISAHKT